MLGTDGAWSNGRGEARRSGGPAVLAAIAVASCVLATLLAGATGGRERDAQTLAFEHLQRQMRREEVPPVYAPISFALFLSLPELPIRTMPDLVAVDEMERQAVSLTGYVARILPVPTKLAATRSTEYNFQVHLRPTSVGRCLIEDSPRDVIAVVTPAFQPPRGGWELEQLRVLCERQDKVRISGWLLYDYLSRSGVGRWRASAWSIHPVTRIEIWNPREQAWDNLS
jgi:hypothetical protein